MRRGLTEARRWVDVTIGRAPAADDAQQRIAALTRGASTALVARAAGVVAGLVTVPLSVRYLGPDRYGAWVTMASCIAWLQMADFGIGNGLTNAMGEAIGLRRDDLVSEHVATAFWVMTLIAAAVGAAFFAVWPFIDWGGLFNVGTDVARAEVGRAVAVATALFLLSFPLTLVPRVFAAHREGAIANAWAIGGSLTVLASVLAATRTRAGIVGLVIAVSGAQTLALAASAVWLFVRHRPKLLPHPRLVSARSAWRVGRDAAQFFALQLVAVVMFSTDNVIIARVLGAERVTPYSVAWRLFTIPGLFVALYEPYLQPAYAEAYARRDLRWVSRALRITLVLTAGVSVAVAAPLVAFGTSIIRWWAGAVAVPPQSLLWWMGAWAIIGAPASALACMLNGLGQLRVQILFGACAALVNVVLSVQLARTHGITGVIAATVVSYLACAAVPATLNAIRVLGARSRGEAPANDD